MLKYDCGSSDMLRPGLPPRVKIEAFFYAGMVELGSEPSAAGVGYSEASEWPRSTDEEGASPPTKMSGTATGRLGGFRFQYRQKQNMRAWWNW